MRRKRRAALALTLALAASMAVAVAPASATEGVHDYTYRITVANLNGNQTVTPIVAATHESSFRLFKSGREASNGLQQLAENGGVPVLAEELSANRKVESVAVIGSTPLAPGDSAAAMLATDRRHRRLSLAGMLICTNDGFTGRSSIRLPSVVGHQRTFYAHSYDAGSEVNTQAYADLVPPCDGIGGATSSNPDLAEGGVVTRHGGIIEGVGDLTTVAHGWEDPVLKITVERVKVYEVTVENLTNGQPVTPTVFATHARWSGIFEEGDPATNGLQQLAENGGVPVLTAELETAHGVGAVAVVGSGPILPGTSASAEVIVADRYRRASLAGMLVCTNDGFGGVDSLRLPRWVGDTQVVYGGAFDAGTETNTEMYVDLVPPCDGAGGSTSSNPDLAEGGVVREHAGILGGHDLSPAIHGWDGPVLKVTVERIG